MRRLLEEENRQNNMDRLFGTDGIRGIPGVYPLTDGMIFKIGKAIAHLLLSQKHQGKAIDRNLKIIIGKDTRLSCQRIEVVFSSAVTSFGIDVLLAGIIPTPGLAFLTKKLKVDMGIMISASHNKATDNGMKFFNAKGHKLSCQEEEQIEKIIFDNLTPDYHPREKGKISIVRGAQAKYVKFLSATLGGLDLKDMRIALDCASGAASPFAKRLFTKLGVKVYSINDIPQGDNINNGGAIDPTSLRDLVLKTQVHIGVAVDGDGDRGILVDEKGNVLDGDYIMAITADYLMKRNKLAQNTVVATVLSNYGLKTYLENIGVKVILAKVGDKHVLQELLTHNLNLGGEQSGHIIFLDYLPTPDGLLTAIQVLKIMKETGVKLSELAKCITKFPQVLVNVKVKEKKPFEELSSLDKRLQYFNKRLNGEGRILLRYSGTEPLARVMVEGKDEAIITDIAHSLAEQIRKEIGLNENETYS